MLIEVIEHVKAAGGSPKTLWGKVYGQEKVLATSAIARMNLLLHGVEDFKIWVELTHGTLRFGPHNASIRGILQRFDAELTPEDRLILIEYGEEVLGAVADDVARQHRRADAHTPVEGRADVG